jgi:hypothetical protein
MDEPFDAAPMYDEDYLYFFAARRGLTEFAGHGRLFLALMSRLRRPRSWPGACWICDRA